MIDYDLFFEKGELANGRIIYRAVAKTSDGIVLKGSKNGFGHGHKEAVEDFIRRNDSKIIDQIFDLEEKK